MAGAGDRASWETLFWAVFAASGNAMMIADADGRIVSANASLQRLLGRPEEELAGKPVDGHVFAPDTVAGGDSWGALLARGEGTGACEVLAADGSRVAIEYAGHVAHVGGRLVVLLVLMAAGERPHPGDAPPPAPLTARELEVVGRLAMGATSREVADDLHVTPETVRTHVRNAMAKTGTRTRAHLVAAVICRGFLPAISSS